MKKHLLGAILALTSCSILAESQDSMYLKVGAIANMGHSLDSANLAKIGVTTDTDTYGEGNMGFSVGLGYHLMENTRAEFNLTYLSGPLYKYDFTGSAANPFLGTGLGSLDTDTNNSTVATSGNAEVESAGWVGLATGQMDLANFEVAKIYVGAGAGFSYLENKISFEPTRGDNKSPTTVEYTEELKFAWDIEAGASFAASEAATVDVSYSYMSLGKPGSNKSTTNFAGDQVSANNASLKWPFKENYSHSVNLSIRFNM